MTDLFDAVRFGDLQLANRIVLAPMTRSRAGADGVINASAAAYYGARAGAGMINTEGVNIGPMSNVFDRAPGLCASESGGRVGFYASPPGNGSGEIYPEPMVLDRRRTAALEERQLHPGLIPHSATRARRRSWPAPG